MADSLLSNAAGGLTASDEAKIAELRAIVTAIRDRVRSQYPESSAVVDDQAAEPIHVPLADLMPLVHARDSAQAKMAALGSVNPRPPGLANNAIQFVKRSVARGLGWFVRDQIVFNRGVMECVEASIEAMNDMNRSVASLAASMGKSLQDGRNEWEARKKQDEAGIRETVLEPLGEARRLAEARYSEARKLIADLQQLVVTRMSLLENNYRDLNQAQHGEFTQMTRAQHAEFGNSIRIATEEIQQQLSRDLQRIKMEFERVIHSELRVIRQRGLTTEAVPAPITPQQHAGVDLDYQAFSHRFRGSEEYVKANQSFYVERFRGVGDVLDIGCGQGEFLEVLRDAGIRGHGIDLSATAVANCSAKGLNAEEADLFQYLSDRPGNSLDGIFISQVVEHLPGDRIPEMIRLCAAKLRHDGLLAIETPNPECLAIFATHFYLDPTHVRPVPSALLAFYMEENGMGGIDVQTRFPAAQFFPELMELPEGVRNRFFGGLDYAIFARKL